MEKKDFQKLFRNYMKAKGFQVKGNYSHKFLGDDYLIGVWLDHHPFLKAYFVEYGVIYAPDEKRLPFSGWCDWTARFQFAANPDEDLRDYPIEDMDKWLRPQVIDWFEYDTRTERDFINSLDVNVEKRLAPVYDKEYVLDQYRRNWILFRMIPYKTLHKISTLAGLDTSKVIEFRDSNRKTWVDM